MEVEHPQTTTECWCSNLSNTTARPLHFSLTVLCSVSVGTVIPARTAPSAAAMPLPLPPPPSSPLAPRPPLDPSSPHREGQECDRTTRVWARRRHAEEEEEEDSGADSCPLNRPRVVRPESSSSSSSPSRRHILCGMDENTGARVPLMPPTQDHGVRRRRGWWWRRVAHADPSQSSPPPSARRRAPPCFSRVITTPSSIATINVISPQETGETQEGYRQCPPESRSTRTMFIRRSSLYYLYRGWKLFLFLFLLVLLLLVVSKRLVVLTSVWPAPTSVFGDKPDRGDWGSGDSVWSTDTTPSSASWLRHAGGGEGAPLWVQPIRRVKLFAGGEGWMISDPSPSTASGGKRTRAQKKRDSPTMHRSSRRSRCRAGVVGGSDREGGGVLTSWKACWGDFPSLVRWASAEEEEAEESGSDTVNHVGEPAVEDFPPPPPPHPWKYGDDVRRAYSNGDTHWKDKGFTATAGDGVMEEAGENRCREMPFAIPDSSPPPPPPATTTATATTVTPVRRDTAAPRGDVKSDSSVGLPPGQGSLVEETHRGAEKIPEAEKTTDRVQSRERERGRTTEENVGIPDRNSEVAQKGGRHREDSRARNLTESIQKMTAAKDAKEEEKEREKEKEKEVGESGMPTGATILNARRSFSDASNDAEPEGPVRGDGPRSVEDALANSGHPDDAVNPSSSSTVPSLLPLLLLPPSSPHAAFSRRDSWSSSTAPRPSGGQQHQQHQQDDKEDTTFLPEQMRREYLSEYAGVEAYAPVYPAELDHLWHRVLYSLYVQGNLTEVVRRAMEATAAGSRPAQWLMGVLHAHGIGVERNEVLSVLHYQFAATPTASEAAESEEGYPPRASHADGTEVAPYLPAHLALAHRYANGIGVAKDCAAAVQHGQLVSDAIAMSFLPPLSPPPPPPPPPPASPVAAATPMSGAQKNAEFNKHRKKQKQQERDSKKKEEESGTDSDRHSAGHRTPGHPTTDSAHQTRQDVFAVVLELPQRNLHPLSYSGSRSSRRERARRRKLATLPFWSILQRYFLPASLATTTTTSTATSAWESAGDMTDTDALREKAFFGMDQGQFGWALEYGYRHLRASMSGGGGRSTPPPAAAATSEEKADVGEDEGMRAGVRDQDSPAAGFSAASAGAGPRHRGSVDGTHWETARKFFQMAANGNAPGAYSALGQLYAVGDRDAARRSGQERLRGATAGVKNEEAPLDGSEKDSVEDNGASTLSSPFTGKRRAMGEKIPAHLNYRRAHQYFKLGWKHEEADSANGLGFLHALGVLQRDRWVLEDGELYGDVEDENYHRLDDLLVLHHHNTPLEEQKHGEKQHQKQKSRREARREGESRGATTPSGHKPTPPPPKHRDPTRVEVRQRPPADYVTAVSYFKLATERGCLEAMYNLGVCYALGLGVTRDAEMASKLLLLVSIRTGNTLALWQLGNLKIHEERELVRQLRAYPPQRHGFQRPQQLSPQFLSQHPLLVDHCWSRWRLLETVISVGWDQLSHPLHVSVEDVLLDVKHREEKEKMTAYRHHGGRERQHQHGPATEGQRTERDRDRNVDNDDHRHNNHKKKKDEERGGEEERVEISHSSQAGGLAVNPSRGGSSSSTSRGESAASAAMAVAALRRPLPPHLRAVWRAVHPPPSPVDPLVDYASPLWVRWRVGAAQNPAYRFAAVETSPAWTETERELASEEGVEGGRRRLVTFLEMLVAVELGHGPGLGPLMDFPLEESGIIPGEDVDRHQDNDSQQEVRRRSHPPPHHRGAPAAIATTTDSSGAASTAASSAAPALATTTTSEGTAAWTPEPPVMSSEEDYERTESDVLRLREAVQSKDETVVLYWHYLTAAPLHPVDGRGCCTGQTNLADSDGSAAATSQALIAFSPFASAAAAAGAGSRGGHPFAGVFADESEGEGEGEGGDAAPNSKPGRRPPRVRRWMSQVEALQHWKYLLLSREHYFLRDTGTAAVTFLHTATSQNAMHSLFFPQAPAMEEAKLRLADFFFYGESLLLGKSFTRAMEAYRAISVPVGVGGNTHPASPRGLYHLGWMYQMGISSASAAPRLTEVLRAGRMATMARAKRQEERGTGAVGVGPAASSVASSTSPSFPLSSSSSAPYSWWWRLPWMREPTEVVDEALSAEPVVTSLQRLLLLQYADPLLSSDGSQGVHERAEQPCRTSAEAVHWWYDVYDLHLANKYYEEAIAANRQRRDRLLERRVASSAAAADSAAERHIAAVHLAIRLMNWQWWYLHFSHVCRGLWRWGGVDMPFSACAAECCGTGVACKEGDDEETNGGTHGLMPAPAKDRQEEEEEEWAEASRLAESNPSTVFYREQLEVARSRRRDAARSEALGDVLQRLERTLLRVCVALLLACAWIRYWWG